MNAGYLSLLLMLVSSILFASGWKDIILRGIAPRSLLLFFVFWTLASGQFCEWHGWRLYGPALLLAGLLASGLLRTKSWLVRLHIASAGMLIGAVGFFLKETVHFIPRLTLLDGRLLVGGMTGWITAALIRAPLLQLSALSAGVLTIEALYGLLHRDRLAPTAGSPDFQDLWWVGVFAARGISLAMNGIAYSGRRLLRALRLRPSPGDSGPMEEDPIQ